MAVGVKKAEKRQNALGLRKNLGICTVWTLQIPEPEAMPYKHQKWYGLENSTEGSLDQGECAIKILWRAEDGKVIKMEVERAKSRNLAGISLISPQKMIARN